MHEQQPHTCAKQQLIIQPPRLFVVCSEPLMNSTSTGLSEDTKGMKMTVVKTFNLLLTVNHKVRQLSERGRSVVISSLVKSIHKDFPFSFVPTTTANNAGAAVLTARSLKQ